MVFLRDIEGTTGFVLLSEFLANPATECDRNRSGRGNESLVWVQ
ncbi:hypothetical protein RISK_004993 [Rhodopirellula islandica]|uniref:Uncharacterized protein n=1 Tax=Rhodopirellula islandica TaxID=595434 RepID=A0A0J1B918_RHOIS|nr:hypothetical protein RISK_004993 [Rhodopirellula islandica]